ncbi:hypothetical protein HZU77_004630 [Neisseriaceae bacterium TC5R-5]|nr:hypothetical protein [Neisseriaceae bacterium TC5R-5]
MNKIKLYCWISCLCAATSVAHAEQAVPQQAATDIASDGKWHFGGAIRLRYDQVYSPQPATSRLGIDTIRADVDYNSSTWFGAAQYRFYGHFYPYHYTDDFGRINFPAFAWAGYKISPESSIIGGINQIPFGLLPYVSSTFYQTLANPAGLEDVHNLGLKYEYKKDNLDVHLAFYPRDGGNWTGTSKDANRYSVNVVNADNYMGNSGTNNQERNQWVARLAYAFGDTKDNRTELGISTLYSTLENQDTHQNGTRRAHSIHYSGQYDKVGVLAQWTRQDMSPRNPVSTGNDVVTFGAFDGSYNVAAKGNFYSAELNYAIPWANSWIKDIKPYLNYSAYHKDKSGFKTSQRILAGVQFANGPIYSYIELRRGRNDPFTGDYTTGLAEGGSDQWKKTLYINIGYYF